MKKLYILASLAVAAAAFTSCEADKEPIYHAPEPATFVLNTPPMANQLYILTDGGSVNLTTSQPDYGVATTTQYSVDVTLDSEFKEATPDGEEANYKTITPKVPTQAQIELDAKTLDEALCQLMGISSFAQYPEEGIAPVKVTMRAHAWITNIASSECVSNNIILESVQLFNPFPQVPGFVYLVGSPTGWNDPVEGNSKLYADWAIEETGVGTGIYEGSVNIPAGAQEFRFYTQLSGWDTPNASLGAPAAGTVINFSSSDLSLDPTYTQNNWKTDESWAGGDVTFVFDLTDEAAPKITAKEGKFMKETYVYLVGSMAGWAEPSEASAAIYENWRLIDRGGTGIYTNTFNIAAGDLYFRVYPELTGWGATPYSSDNGGSDLNMTLGDAYKCVTGEGCWTFNWAGGDLTFVLDTTVDPATLTVSAATE